MNTRKLDPDEVVGSLYLVTETDRWGRPLDDDSFELLFRGIVPINTHENGINNILGEIAPGNLILIVHDVEEIRGFLLNLTSHVSLQYKTAVNYYAPQQSIQSLKDSWFNHIKVMAGAENIEADNSLLSSVAFDNELFIDEGEEIHPYSLVPRICCVINKLTEMGMGELRDFRWGVTLYERPNHLFQTIEHTTQNDKAVLNALNDIVSREMNHIVFYSCRGDTNRNSLLKMLNDFNAHTFKNNEGEQIKTEISQVWCISGKSSPSCQIYAVENGALKTMGRTHITL